MPYNITYMWNPNQDTDELVYETETDIENLPRGGAEEVVGGGWIGSLGLADAKYPMFPPPALTPLTCTALLKRLWPC